MTATLDQAAADPQQIIVELQRQLDERTRRLDECRAELAARNSEFGERIEHQSATIDVLKAMSATPGDPQPVFDLIARRARDLCNGQGVGLFEFDGELVHLRSRVNPFSTPEAVEAYERLFPMVPTRGSISCRAILDRQTIHVRDMATAPGVSAAVRDLGYKSQIVLPLLRDGAAIGAVSLTSLETGGFSDSQVALLQTFAEQAVIAITSAQTYLELQQRTGDLQELLEYQTATSDVLKVISRSTADVQPVLDTVVETAARLCGAYSATIAIREGEVYRYVSSSTAATEPERWAITRQRTVVPGRGSIAARVALEGRVVHIEDIRAIPDVALPETVASGRRTQLGVPLLRNSEPIGIIVLARKRVEPFTDRQIKLVRTFADQAVIAMENARLITETREALEQQTATAEVLGVINSSPGDLAPVFDAILEKAHTLCGVSHGGLVIYDGEHFRAVATRGMSEEYGAVMRSPFRAAPGGTHEGLLRGERFIHVPDMQVRRGATNPTTRVAIEAGSRTMLAVPLRKDGALLGLISAHRKEVRPFAEKEIALLENFAAQAVIAMENARLLGELQTRTADLEESLEYQTATSDVLNVISGSSFDVQPVFETILETAARLCDADGGWITSREGEAHRVAATYAQSPEYDAVMRGRLLTADRGSVAGRTALEGRVVHVADVASDPEYTLTEAVTLGKYRTCLGVPLLREGVVVGVISIGRHRVQPFTERQIELVRTFADQAVIALENARLLKELQQRTDELAARNSEFGERIEHQSATIDVLQVMSASPGDPQPVFDLIVRRARDLCNTPSAGLFEFDGELVHRRSWVGTDAYGPAEAYEAYKRLFPMVPTRGSLTCRAILDRQIIHVRDMATEPGVSAAVRNVGHKSQISVPLLRDGAAIGAVVLSSGEIGGFTDSQVALLQTFAEQAVIAITSAETYRELQQRTDELTRSVAELQALEEVARAVNSSLDLDTVLATVIGRAVLLSQADEGMIYEFDETEEVFVPKSAFGMSAERVEALRERRIKLGETHLGRSAIERAPVYVADVQQDPSVPHAARTLPGIHAVLAVPLLREDKVVGGLVIRRRSGTGFAPTIATLMQTFAAQSVLAIENARLFQELAARGEEARRAHAAAENALADLRRAQDRLIQAEKMASLGQLTAGIAHEIKNPLNFVNNFAGLSVELLDELKEAAAPALATFDGDKLAEVDEIVAMLTGNLEKIAEHGRRADGIVKSMLEHSRGESGERRPVDLNALVEEALNLAYHGARAQDQSFNIALERDFAAAVAPIELVPQDVTRVLLNLIGNGFYAAIKRLKDSAEPGFRPTLKVATCDLGEAVEIRVHDNGAGIMPEIRDKLFQPFFTTKPTGEGTGLGLSISYDIVTQQHGGTIAVDSRVGEFTEFAIHLPRTRGTAPTATTTTETAAARMTA